MNISRLLPAIIILGALIVSSIPSAVFAQDTEKLTLSPTSKRYEVDAGSTHQDSIRVINNGETAYDFTVYARPYSVNNEAYEPNFEEVTPRSQAYRWVQFEETDFRLKPGEETEIRYTMRVPQDAAPGGHYGVIFAETQPKSEGEGNVIARKKRAGTILYAKVNGEIQERGNITHTEIPFWQQQPPLTASGRVENTGNIDFEVTSSMRVHNVFGALVHEENRTQPVLPDTTRAFNLEWTGAPQLGIYKAETTFSFLDQQKVTIGYVLMMPSWLPVLLVILVIAGVGYVVARRFQK